MELTRTTMDKRVVKTMTWQLTDWKECHSLLATARASCYVELGNPKVAIRFYLKPVTKYMTPQSNYYVRAEWYGLFAEVLTAHQNGAVQVIATLTKTNVSQSGTGTLELMKSHSREIPVIEEFLHKSTVHIGYQGIVTSTLLSGDTLNFDEITIHLTVTLYQLNGTGNTAGHGAACEEESSEAEASLSNDMKSFFICGDNYSDLKLETKDNMTVSAHKFQVAARSSYLRKMMEDAMKKEDFKGVLKLEDVNAKPLMVILHWIYTGELHENAGRVMEEVADAAILFELTHLLKVLDKKLITICNKENMFRLYQVAQKNAMPTAMDDISVYIREHI